jgi:transposase
MKLLRLGCARLVPLVKTPNLRYGSHGSAFRRRQWFRRFLTEIDTAIPPDSEVHLVMDNCGTHKVDRVRSWFSRHPSYHVHFTPTSGSWLNLVCSPR